MRESCNFIILIFPSEIGNHRVYAALPFNSIPPLTVFPYNLFSLTCRFTFPPPLLILGFCCHLPALEVNNPPARTSLGCGQKSRHLGITSRLQGEYANSTQSSTIPYHATPESLILQFLLKTVFLTLDFC